MAERRMFAKTITESDAFLDMPLSTQALYFHLGMIADDDGFINSPRRVQRMIGGGDDDLKLLIAKNFVIPFESGVVVIKHWKMNNYIQKDRYHATNYVEEKKLLSVKENGAYSLVNEPCIQDVYKMDTEVRLGKVSIDKDSVDKDSQGESRSDKERKENSCGSNSTDFLEILTDEEIAYLKTLYENAYDLIDEVTIDATKKRKQIKNPFSYIIGYAENVGWLEKNGQV